MLRTHSRLREFRFALVNIVLEFILIFFYLQDEFYNNNLREFHQCIARKNSAMHHLRVDDYDVFTPRETCVIALDDLPVGTLICGTKLYTRRPSDSHMFFHNPNSLSIPHHIAAGPLAFGRHHYSWSNYELLQDINNEYIHPSCLFASTSDSPPCFPNDNTSTNIVLHFLPNGYTVGEVVAPTGYCERLVRNSNPGIHTWLPSREVEDWSTQTSVHRANIISNHRSCPQPNFYYETCIVHDIEETAFDGQIWALHDDFVQIAIAMQIRSCISRTAASPFY